MYCAVDDGGCHGGVTDDGWPAGEFQIRGVDDRLGFVGVSDDLVDQACPVEINGQITEFINDDQFGFTDLGGSAF